MKRFVILRLHHETYAQVVSLKDGEESHRAVETLQRKLKEAGKPTALTWQLHEGDIISALIAAHKASD